MACILGIESDGNVLLASDSELGGLHETRDGAGFVFRAGEVVIGMVGDLRAADILRVALPPVVPTEDEAIDRFVKLDFVNWISGALITNGGYDSSGPRGVVLRMPSKSKMLIGIRDRLFTIGTDYEVDQPFEGYAAIGTASQVAHGALYATLGWDCPIKRAHVSLAAAAQHVAGVGGLHVLVATGELAAVAAAELAAA